LKECSEVVCQRTHERDSRFMITIDVELKKYLNEVTLTSHSSLSPDSPEREDTLLHDLIHRGDLNFMLACARRNQTQTVIT
jgi:hypothetical protein